MRLIKKKTRFAGDIWIRAYPYLIDSTWLTSLKNIRFKRTQGAGKWLNERLKNGGIVFSVRVVVALQAQKEILDTELDIISKQNEGADTSALRRRVAALKKEVSRLLWGFEQHYW